MLMQWYCSQRAETLAQIRVFKFGRHAEFRLGPSLEACAVKRSNDACVGRLRAWLAELRTLRSAFGMI
jgi:hypothetical protein